MINEEKLEIFIESVERYFNQANKTDVKVGTPYLVENNTPASHEMTGLIGITGPYKGCVYFSAQKILLRHLLISIGEQNYSDDNMHDLVGEIANIIAGNAREGFGPNFMITVPIIISGSSENIHLPKDARSFVIPMCWKAYEALIVVSLVSN